MLSPRFPDPIMAGLRSFHVPLSPESSRIVLSETESHHLVRVRRAREGDPVEVIDNAGHRAAACLLQANGKAAELRIDHVVTESPPAWHLTLAQALPKGKTMDSVVQRATELGVDRIVPLFTRHSDVDLDARRAEQKTLKWQQTALESAKQCGNPWLPVIETPRSLEHFLAERPSWDQALVAALTENPASIREFFNDQVKGPFPEESRLVVFVGPEGDFSGDEYERLFSLGVRAVSLGPRVLRVETAACALLAICLEELRHRYR